MVGGVIARGLGDAGIFPGGLSRARRQGAGFQYSRRYSLESPIEEAGTDSSN